MRFILILTAFLQITLASNEWEQFKTTYNKLYNSIEDENYHKEIFLERLKLVKEHNKKYEQGVSSYKVGINKLSDRLRPETQAPSPKTVKELVVPRDNVDVPDSIDWRDYGVVTPIADQSGCETCWAFAIVGTIEAHMNIYKNENVSLSQQNLADCVFENFTCQTDLRDDMLDKAYQYIVDNKGIDTRESYPYEYYAIGECRYNPENIGASIAGYGTITEGDEEELKRIVGTVGPVTVAIHTSYLFDGYMTGVFHEENCGSVLNHAVIIVGYGTEDGEDYWIVKNSWGTWFGDNGYIKMARNRDNNCGIATIARYPLM